MKTRELINLEVEDWQRLGYNKVIVRYMDLSKKVFTLHKFDTHKAGIVDIYNRNKCMIKFKKKSLFEKLFKKRKPNYCYSCNKNTLVLPQKNGSTGCIHCGATYNKDEIELFKKSL